MEIDQGTDAPSAAEASSRAEKRYPIYCPLEISYDPERLLRELLGVVPKLVSLGTLWFNLEQRSRWFDVGDDYLYSNVEHIKPDPSSSENFLAVPGKVPGWRGLSLTHVPGRPETDLGAARHRRDFDGQWVWKEDFDLPYTRQVIDSLPLDRVDVVRVINLPRGGFGPAHKDCPDDSPWEVDGIASISFILRDGGVPTRLLASDGRVHDVFDPVFFFKDSAPHAVPQTTSDRLMLRVNGAADPRRIYPLMQWDNAIW